MEESIINKIIEKKGVIHIIKYKGFFIGDRISEILNIKRLNIDFVNNKIRI
jgi:hypothetical protein